MGRGASIISKLRKQIRSTKPFKPTRNVCLVRVVSCEYVDRSYGCFDDYHFFNRDSARRGGLTSRSYLSFANPVPQPLVNVSSGISLSEFSLMSTFLSGVSEISIFLNSPVMVLLRTRWRARLARWVVRPLPVAARVQRFIVTIGRSENSC